MKLGFGSVLFIVLLILKLTGVIAWSWWIITAPLYVPLIIGISILLVVAYLISRETEMSYLDCLNIVWLKSTDQLSKGE